MTNDAVTAVQFRDTKKIEIMYLGGWYNTNVSIVVPIFYNILFCLLNSNNPQYNFQITYSLKHCHDRR